MPSKLSVSPLPQSSDLALKPSQLRCGCGAEICPVPVAVRAAIPEVSLSPSLESSWEGLDPHEGSSNHPSTADRTFPFLPRLSPVSPAPSPSRGIPDLALWLCIPTWPGLSCPHVLAWVGVLTSLSCPSALLSPGLSLRRLISGLTAALPPSLLNPYPSSHI